MGGREDVWCDGENRSRLIRITIGLLRLEKYKFYFLFGKKTPVY